MQSIEENIYDALDTVYFINDIMQQGYEAYSIKIHEMLLQKLILPILASSIITEKIESHHIPIPVALYMISQIMIIIKYPLLSRDITALMFNKEIPLQYLQIMKESLNYDIIPLINHENTVNNPIYFNICEFLSCKDDNLISLSFFLMQTCIDSSINTEELVNIGIFPGKSDGEYIKILSMIGEILMSDMHFRFITYFQGVKLLKSFHDKIIIHGPRIEHQIIKNILRKHIDIMDELLKQQHFCDKFLKLFERE